MKTLIHEIGVIDKFNEKHPVFFQKGLNVVTGKSSTGKSALIEIFDYCFASSEYTVPQGVITDNAEIYYVCLQIKDQVIVIARRPDINNKAFLRSEDEYLPKLIHAEYFENQYFRPLDDYKKDLRGRFLDIDDVDESLAARENRKYKQKSATPSIRSFASFMLQHQNLVANKHALFYRFDEKEKRDQLIDHTKIFLGLVDQNFFTLSQEKERLTADLNALKREQESNKRAATKHSERIGPVLNELYAMMGFKDQPISLKQILRNPQDVKNRLDKIIVSNKIIHTSDAATLRHTQLNQERTSKTAELRKLQRHSLSIRKHITEDEKFVENVHQFKIPHDVHVAATVCPFCHTEKDSLKGSAEKLAQAIIKIKGNLAQARPMKAKFETSLVDINRKIEQLIGEINDLSKQIAAMEKKEMQLAEQKSLHESILTTKAELFVLLEALNLADDIELDKRLSDLNENLKRINADLEKYDTKIALKNSSEIVNRYMADIGQHFEFERSYTPINLHFSFETFDLYHQTSTGQKIYLRSMGSGANWLYSHVTLFLALHKYFAELGDKCAIPSILFLDQPTQVYFPNFKRDISETFGEQRDREKQQRTDKEPTVDDDIKAVENLFSQLSIYCKSIEDQNGFSPQIIVTDHADDLILSNGVLFESLVNGNRWRKRGLIDPLPNVEEHQ